MALKLQNKEKKKILDFVQNFAEVAKKNKWVSHYDKDNDSFAMRAPKLSKDARKRYINKEFALYLTSKNDIEGVFIEYAFSNLVSHHKKDFKIFGKVLREGKRKQEKSLIEFKKTETKKVASELETVILDSMIGNVSCVCTA